VAWGCGEWQQTIAHLHSRSHPQLVLHIRCSAHDHLRRDRVPGPAGPGPRTFLDVTIVAGSVQLSKDAKVIRVHPIRHDRSRELGAFANPPGRARRKNSAIGYVGWLPELFCRPGTGT
jgi:hypothetical protein